MALRHPLVISKKSARYLSFFDSILSPLVSVLTWSTKIITKVILPKQHIETLPLTSNVELEELSHQTRQYVMNLVSIEQTRVHNVYLPWSNVTYLDFQQSVHDVEQTLAHSGHTRLPVMKNQEVIGLINAKEFMILMHSEQTEWQSIIRPFVKVQWQDPALKALLKMQEKRSHLSIVYEGQILKGIVTMEDILEEIIGDVYDEDDDGIIKKLMTHKGKKMFWTGKPPSS
jgi:putative hemolysin